MFRVIYNFGKLFRKMTFARASYSLQRYLIIVTFSRVDYQGPHYHRTKQHPRSADQVVL